MVEDRIKTILSTIPDATDIEPKEVMQLAGELESKDYQHIAGCIIYLRKRELEKAPRYEAFKAAFPHRCVLTDPEKGAFETDRELGDEISKSAITIKAKRLEASSAYKKVHALLSTSLYIAFAVERLKVLDEVLMMSLDRSVSDRDRHNYMKLFLDETRKPDSAKGFEFNVNVQSNTINVQGVEDKMNKIAQALNHASATEVLDMIGKGKVVNNGDSSED